MHALKGLRIIGVVTVITALLGLIATVPGLIAAFTGAFDKMQIPGFYSAYFVMVTITLVCCLTMLLCGFKLFRLDTSFIWIFVSVSLFEIVYFVSVSFMWGHEVIGRPVAAATGVANGGLMPQFFVLLPLWGPLVAIKVKLRNAIDAISDNK